MIVDCHFHVDETMLTLDKMMESMEHHHIAKTVLISPMNETMFEVESTFQHNLQRLFRILILHVPTVGLKIYDGLVTDGKLNLYGNAYKVLTEPNNKVVEEAITRFPDRFLGWATVNPLLHESIEEVKRYLEKPGFVGVKAHPFMHQYSIQTLDPVAEMCEKLGKPMIIHLSAEKDSYKYLPENYPDLKLIYAHAGLPFWKNLWKYISNKPNVYVDTSSDYLNPSIVKQTVKALGYEKVLYGCDGPYGMTKFNEYDYAEKKSWIKQLPITDSEKECILGKNFLQLIGGTE
ncbi:putative TIM-barrel fold metal-dependent hydrolase [Salirhabdus euzebyi]|uniref:Putative TIM-barrel fold metal-dependent hydrolase n=1 Tax=Salirhabdus euzebyi TaxID=394506 RepID=A0A841Q1Z9_9BACI|nr:amidohydrolase family protein [Salirhabdus euzebyi]MBB6452533.1 putative TIM-barrel fold metal-dependent hydrolase [Salirhabdus euzebyi]